MRLGNVARADIEPIRSDKGNSVADAHLVLPNGFIWKDGEIVDRKLCDVNIGDLPFRHENSSAFLSEVEYNV